MANNELQMPADYMALNESEISCVEGGGIISQVCYAFGRMFRSTYYDKWESESKTLEQSHGAVVSKKNGVYTYSDGYTHTMSGGSNWGFTSLGDFFYGIGDLFAAFYLSILGFCEGSQSFNLWHSSSFFIASQISVTQAKEYHYEEIYCESYAQKAP